MMTPCIVLPLVKINNEISEFMSTEGIMDNINSNSRNALFSNLNYQKALIAALEHLEKIGFLQ